MVPLTPPHAVNSNIVLGDYKLTEVNFISTKPTGNILAFWNFMIRKLFQGTSFLVNLYSVLMDKEHWGDPEVFRPERFLNENGAFVRDPYSISFGHGTN